MLLTRVGRDTPEFYAYFATTMSSLTVSIPDSVRERAESLAREDGVSLDAFVAPVLSQRVSSAEADSYIRLRASHGSAQQMLGILDRAPKIEPEPYDRLEPPTKG